jgi:hypothetical protein
VEQGGKAGGVIERQRFTRRGALGAWEILGGEEEAPNLFGTAAVGNGGGFTHTEDERDGVEHFG